MSWGHILLVLSPALAACFVPGIIRQIARLASPAQARRARGARKGCASRRAPRLPNFELIGHGIREGWRAQGAVHKYR